MHVLHAVFNDEAPRCRLVVEGFQFGEQQRQFVVGNEVNAVQHAHVGNGAQNVVGGEIEVEFAVVSYGEAVNFFSDLYVFFPEFHVRKNKRSPFVASLAAWCAGLLPHVAKVNHSLLY